MGDNQTQYVKKFALSRDTKCGTTHAKSLKPAWIGDFKCCGFA